VILGEVDAELQAIIRLTVLDLDGVGHELAAIVDTGYTGALLLPSRMIDMLALPIRGRGRAILADGSSTVFDIYRAVVIWDGHPRELDVDEGGDEPLIGMELLAGHELCVRAIPGGEVRIAAIEPSGR
jgi:clan AA aspartic protease